MYVPTSVVAQLLQHTYIKLSLSSYIGLFETFDRQIEYIAQTKQEVSRETNNLQQKTAMVICTVHTLLQPRLVVFY